MSIQAIQFNALFFLFFLIVMTEGILNRSLWKALLVWIVSNCGLVLVPSLLVVFLAVIELNDIFETF